MRVETIEDTLAVLRSEQKIGLFALMERDIRCMIIDWDKKPLKYWLLCLIKILLYPRIQAVLAFRLAHYLFERGLEIPAYYLQGWILTKSGADLHPAAQIGPWFCLVHSSGVVIGNEARIGARFVCFHGTTIGNSGKGDGMPVLGDFVTLSAGAKVLGGVTIGSHATVGANAVVLTDVTAGGVAVGIPARVVKVNPIPPG